MSLHNRKFYKLLNGDIVNADAIASITSAYGNNWNICLVSGEKILITEKEYYSIYNNLTSTGVLKIM